MSRAEAFHGLSFSLQLEKRAGAASWPAVGEVGAEEQVWGRWPWLQWPCWGRGVVRGAKGLESCTSFLNPWDQGWQWGLEARSWSHFCPFWLLALVPTQGEGAGPKLMGFICGTWTFSQPPLPLPSPCGSMLFLSADLPHLRKRAGQ